jgi:hypothetical protein
MTTERALLLLAFLGVGCHRRPVLAERCAMVQAILAHRAALPNAPDGYRAPARDDGCARDKALWRGRLLVDARVAEGERRFFAEGDRCEGFAIYTSAMNAGDLPEGKMILEVDGQGERYQWRWWINSIANPNAGGCVPGRGELEKTAGRWATRD